MDINANEILRNLVDEMLSDVEDIPELLQGLSKILSKIGSSKD
ncbi:hypothetical protein [Saccharolobus islandicus]|nr:hypothetical protein [Sulfolobus islandicus]